MARAVRSKRAAEKPAGKQPAVRGGGEGASEACLAPGSMASGEAVREASRRVEGRCADGKLVGRTTANKGALRERPRGAGGLGEQMRAGLNLLAVDGLVDVEGDISGGPPLTAARWHVQGWW
eukprot:scaffold10143_cov120-Isochrysis_galbana.AAC.1